MNVRANRRNSRVLSRGFAMSTFETIYLTGAICAFIIFAAMVFHVERITRDIGR